MKGPKSMVPFVRISIALGLCVAACAPNRSHGTPSRSAADVLRRVAPDVTWGEVLEVNLEREGVSDHAVLGRTRTEAVVGVVLSGKHDTPVIFKFPHEPGRQNGICVEPARVRLVVEHQLSADDAEAPEGVRHPKSGKGVQGLRLENGDCDAFHFYFDGKTVTWWRR